MLVLMLVFALSGVVFPTLAQDTDTPEMTEQLLDGGYTLMIPADWEAEREEDGDEGYYFSNDEMGVYVLGPVEFAAVFEPDADASAEEALNAVIDEWVGADAERDVFVFDEQDGFQVASEDYTNENDEGDPIEGTWYVLKLENGEFAFMDFYSDPEVVYAQDELVGNIVSSLYPVEVDTDGKTTQLLDGGYSLLTPADWSAEREEDGDEGYYFFNDEIDLYMLGPDEFAGVFEADADASAEEVLNSVIEEWGGVDIEPDDLVFEEQDGFQVARWDYIGENDEGDPIEGTWYVLKLETGEFAFMDFYGDVEVVHAQDELVGDIVRSLYTVEVDTDGKTTQLLDGDYTMLTPADWSADREEDGDEGYYFFNDEIDLYVLGPVEFAAVFEPDADTSVEAALNAVIDEWVGADAERDVFVFDEQNGFQVASWDHMNENDEGDPIEGTWYVLKLQTGEFAFMDFYGDLEVVYAQNDLVLDIVYSLDSHEKARQVLDGDYTMVSPVNWETERQEDGNEGYYFFNNQMGVYVLGPVEFAAVFEPDPDASAEEMLHTVIDEWVGADDERDVFVFDEQDGFQVAGWNYINDTDEDNLFEGTWYVLKLEAGEFAYMDFYGDFEVVYAQDDLVEDIIYSLYPIEVHSDERTEHLLDGGYTLVTPANWRTNRGEAGDEGDYFYNRQLQLYVLGPVEFAAAFEPDADATVGELLHTVIDEWKGADTERDIFVYDEEDGLQAASWNYGDVTDIGVPVDVLWYVLKLETGEFAFMEFFGEPESVFSDLVAEISGSLSLVE